MLSRVVVSAAVPSRSVCSCYCVSIFGQWMAGSCTKCWGPWVGLDVLNSMLDPT